MDAHISVRFSQKMANFMENVTAEKSWIRLVPSNHLHRINAISVSLTQITIVLSVLHWILYRSFTKCCCCYC